MQSRVLLVAMPFMYIGRFREILYKIAQPIIAQSMNRWKPILSSRRSAPMGHPGYFWSILTSPQVHLRCILMRGKVLPDGRKSQPAPK
jgi:hypothetical protein